MAAFPEPYQILGLQLLPLSLGRYRLLQRFECAFVADQETDCEMGDLLVGVLICSMKCDDFLTFIQENALNEYLQTWAAHCGLFDLTEKSLLFRKYVEESSAIPPYTEEESSGRGSSAHWADTVEITLRKELGWTGQEIDESPLTKALADYFHLAEMHGVIRLLSPEDLQAAKANAAIFAAPPTINHQPSTTPWP